MSARAPLRRGVRALVTSALGFVLVVSTVFVTHAVVAPSTSVAQSRSFAEGPVVRRQLLYRSSRLELTPALGVAFGRTYQREIFVGVTGRYHLTNAFAAGVNVQFAGLVMDTSVARNFADSNPQAGRQLYYGQQTLLTDAHVSYTPIAGKFSLFDNTMHFDIHISVGVGGALVSDEGLGNITTDLPGFRFGPALSVGMRTFVTDGVAINLRLTDYMYNSSEAQTIVTGVDGRLGAGPRDNRFGHNFIGMIGASIFLPSEVRVSR